jgi:protein required for attachment to host cells
MIISRKAWVVVADGGRANIFENIGEIGEISLKLLRAVDQHNARKPDDAHDNTAHAIGAQGHNKSSEEPKDLQAAGKHNFLKQLADGLASDVQSGQCAELVLIASPSALGDLRLHMPASLAAKIVKEINKDYTQMAANDLSKALMHLHD